MLISSIILPVFVSISNKYLINYNNIWRNYINEQWNFICAMLQQGVGHKPTHLTGQMLYLIWFLSLSVLISSFGAHLLSQYITPLKYHSIDSIHDMIQTKDLEIIITDNIQTRINLVIN